MDDRPSESEPVGAPVANDAAPPSVGAKPRRGRTSAAVRKAARRLGRFHDKHGWKPDHGKVVNLAFQGGGAHGALTWGVCDRLLEEPDLRIEGITGTSAGAMNAALLVYGDACGGAEGARRSRIAGIFKGTHVSRPHQGSCN